MVEYHEIHLRHGLENKRLYYNYDYDIFSDIKFKNYYSNFSKLIQLN